MSKSGIPVVSDIGKVGGQIVKPLAPILKTVAPILPFLPIPGLGPLSALATRSLLTGIASGLDKSGNFNFNRGLKAGALAYGVGSLMNAANANTLTGTEGMSEGVGYGDVPSSGAAGSDFSGVGQVDTLPTANEVMSSFPNTQAVYPDETLRGSATFASPDITTTGAYATGAPGEQIALKGDVAPFGSQQGFLDNAKAYASQGIDSLTNAVTNVDYAGLPGKAVDAIVKDPINATLAGTTLYGTVKSKQELDAQKAEAERILQDQENKKASDIAWAQGVLRDYPLNYQRLSASDVVAQRGMAMGGLTALARGGRFLDGPGDGTSDSIPARIGGQQEARLADGEFVIDARTVSELGNGSSKAGAKKLYAMMDRVHSARRKAQRGQPSGADRYMPA